MDEFQFDFNKDHSTADCTCVLESTIDITGVLVVMCSQALEISTKLLTVWTIGCSFVNYQMAVHQLQVHCVSLLT